VRGTLGYFITFEWVFILSGYSKISLVEQNLQESASHKKKRLEGVQLKYQKITKGYSTRQIDLQSMVCAQPR
jgi:hypothetical protein